MKSKVMNFVRNTALTLGAIAVGTAITIGGAYLLSKLEEPKGKDKKNFYIVSRANDPMYRGVTGIRRLSFIAQSPARDDSPYMRYYNYLVIDEERLVNEFRLNPENETAYTYNEAESLLDAGGQISNFWRKKQ